MLTAERIKELERIIVLLRFKVKRKKLSDREALEKLLPLSASEWLYVMSYMSNDGRSLLEFLAYHDKYNLVTKLLLKDSQYYLIPYGIIARINNILADRQDSLRDSALEESLVLNLILEKGRKLWGIGSEKIVPKSDECEGCAYKSHATIMKEIFFPLFQSVFISLAEKNFQIVVSASGEIEIVLKEMDARDQKFMIRQVVTYGHSLAKSGTCVNQIYQVTFYDKIALFDFLDVVMSCQSTPAEVSEVVEPPHPGSQLQSTEKEVPCLQIEQQQRAKQDKKRAKRARQRLRQQQAKSQENLEVQLRAIFPDSKAMTVEVVFEDASTEINRFTLGDLSPQDLILVRKVSAICNAHVSDDGIDVVRTVSLLQNARLQQQRQQVESKLHASLRAILSFSPALDVKIIFEDGSAAVANFSLTGISYEDVILIEHATNKCLKGKEAAPDAIFKIDVDVDAFLDNLSRVKAGIDVSIIQKPRPDAEALEAVTAEFKSEVKLWAYMKQPKIKRELELARARKKRRAYPKLFLSSPLHCDKSERVEFEDEGIVRETPEPADRLIFNFGR